MPPLDAIKNYEGKLTGGITDEFYENCDNIPDPKDLNPNLKNLLILDDCYLGPQSKAGPFYSPGRHANSDTMYISPNYFALPRNFVPENSNIIILYPQKSKSVLHIYQDHCTDMPFDEFENLC